MLLPISYRYCAYTIYIDMQWGTCVRQPQLAFTERWLHYRGGVQCFVLVLFWAREARCFIRGGCKWDFFGNHCSKLLL